MFTRQLIEDIAATCNIPTGNHVLDGLFDSYNEASPTAIDSPVYYRFLFRLAKAKPGLKLVELGCKYGAASLHFLKGGGGHSTAIDVGDRVKHELFNGLPFEFVRSRSIDTKALEVGQTLRPEIVFIDTDHSYNTTVGEFHYWSQFVAPGGLILFDDVAAWRHTKREDMGCGRYWDELRAAQPDRCIDLPDLHPDIWGFGAYLAP